MSPRSRAIDCHEGVLSQRKRAAELEKLAKAAGEVEKLKQTIREMEDELSTNSGGLQKQLDDMRTKYLAEQEKVFNLESERRKLQNTIQELRGNVRVFARLRPFLPNDKQREGEESIVTVGMDTLSMSIKDPKNAGSEHKFSFDRAFAAHEGQEEVFKEVSEFVQSALDGYNVTLFSYGQTGSGKTHAMQGSGSEQMRGIIPRAIEQVGMMKAKLEAQGWEFVMHITFVK